MAKATNKVIGEVREQFGKGAARKMRVAGRIPAVIYGHGAATQHISLPAHEVTLILRKANQVLSIDVDGTTELTLVKDVQRDPVRRIIEHLDLVAIKKGEKVHVEVNVHIEGEPYPGTLSMLEVPTLRVEVEATHIPESVIVDVEGAVEGTQYLAGDIELPKGATLLDDDDLLIVNIVTPAAPALPDEDEVEGAAASVGGAAEEEQAAE
ncbi:50S ribosomal protein L25/general stress protein Ctc [Homoserinimonas sp. OAct 916]|uniref:50S ribosomal protein L25/general stress protein Ctc n=1 Tax=Homoserinimonas sp. OAct 916 TaxID=2211450 RepID=UPI000DBE4079|nr:50S ribosomal protein L25/general stress protein Ctc [Homoserinimonas sp. OAct 916]